MTPLPLKRKKRRGRAQATFRALLGEVRAPRQQPGHQHLPGYRRRHLTDWYFTAFPPIMHDIHESGTLLYTYSGGPPQNPNLDPVLFGELSWFANWEMTQMAKWNMPGVYTHAFMDAWSPGYLGFGGLQPQRVDADVRNAEPQGHGRGLPPGRPTGRRGSGGSEEDEEEEEADSVGIFRSTQHLGAPTGRGGSQEREWYRGHPVPEDAVADLHPAKQRQLHPDRRTVGPPTHGHGSPDRPGELLHQVPELHGGRPGRASLRLRDPGATGHDPGGTAPGGHPGPGNRGRAPGQRRSNWRKEPSRRGPT